MVIKLRITYNKERCIGNNSCAKVDPNHFKIIGNVPGNKVDLMGSTKDKKFQYLELVCSEKEAEKAIEAARLCPVNAIGILDLDKNEEIVSTEVKTSGGYEEIKAEYNDEKEFVLDTKGYFLIRVDYENRLIEVGFCRERNEVLVKITGNKPIDIYTTVIKKGLITRMEHAAYLGRELQKAYTALKNNLKYVQDDELDFNSK